MSKTEKVLFPLSNTFDLSGDQRALEGSVIFVSLTFFEAPPTRSVSFSSPEAPKYQILSPDLEMVGEITGSCEARDIFSLYF